MTARAAVVLALVAAVGPSAVAQPVAPAPRPTFSSYHSHLRSAGLGGYASGFGTAYGQEVTPGSAAAWRQPPNRLLDPDRPPTGRGAVFNNLGHWYPAAAPGTTSRSSSITLPRR